MTSSSESASCDMRQPPEFGLPFRRGSYPDRAPRIHAGIGAATVRERWSARPLAYTRGSDGCPSAAPYDNAWMGHHAEGAAMLQVGFGVADITPDKGMQMPGGFFKREG